MMASLATEAPGSKLMALTVPVAGAGSEFCIFMASSTQTRSPVLTASPTLTRVADDHAGHGGPERHVSGGQGLLPAAAAGRGRRPEPPGAAAAAGAAGETPAPRAGATPVITGAPEVHSTSTS